LIRVSRSQGHLTVGHFNRWKYIMKGVFRIFNLSEYFLCDHIILLSFVAINFIGVTFTVLCVLYLPSCLTIVRKYVFLFFKLHAL